MAYSGNFFDPKHFVVEKSVRKSIISLRPNTQYKAHVAPRGHMARLYIYANITNLDVANKIHLVIDHSSLQMIRLLYSQGYATKTGITRSRLLQSSTYHVGGIYCSYANGKPMIIGWMVFQHPWATSRTGKGIKH